MSYQLTLTADERRAIDWIGDRYSHGNDLYDLLSDCEAEQSGTDWTDDGDLTFEVPEHVAWQIRENAEKDEYQWTCFGRELARKMSRFVDAIV